MMQLNLLNWLTKASAYEGGLGVEGRRVCFRFLFLGIFLLNKLQDAMAWAEGAPLVTVKLLPAHKAFAWASHQREVLLLQE